MSSLAAHARKLSTLPGIRMTGKSSVGIMETESKSLSVPEFSRRDLVEACDMLVVDQSALLTPELLKHAVRTNKHLYFSDFPDFGDEGAAGLLKLAGEAGTAIYIQNPLADEPLTGWLCKNRREPLYVNLFESAAPEVDRRSLLLRYLFYAVGLFDAPPRKIRVSGTHHPGRGYRFLNLRLDYDTASTLNLELLVSPKAERSLRAALPGDYLTADLPAGKAWLNHHEMTPLPPATDSLGNFLIPADNGDFSHRSNLGAYKSALDTLEEVLQKSEIFTPWF